jgi:hypothetical protein
MNHPMRIAFADCVGVLLLSACIPLAPVDAASASEFPDVPPGQTRSERSIAGGKMLYWPDRPDQARPMAATFIGGKGTEWLCAGGFQPDGTIVLAGNVNGGEFGLAIPAQVLGRDTAPPGPAEFKTTTDPKGKVSVEVPTWTRPDTTGFLVFATPDLQRITRVVRFPWTSAAITSMAIGSDGAIYLAGRPGPGIVNLGGRQQALSVSPDAERKESHAEAAFIARLSADGSKVEWLHTAAGKTDAPRVTVGASGVITFGAQDLRTFDAGGNSSRRRSCRAA